MRELRCEVKREEVYDFATNTYKVIVLTTIELLRDVINQPPPNGFDTEEMIFRLKMRGIIDNALPKFKYDKTADASTLDEAFFNTTLVIEIEDSDYTKISSLVAIHRWAIPAQFLIDFNKLWAKG